MGTLCIHELLGIDIAVLNRLPNHLIILHGELYDIFVILIINAVVFNYSVDATVSFEQQTYSVNEADGNFQPVLVLSNPSATAITVEVSSTDGLAIGKQLSMLNYT